MSARCHGHSMLVLAVLFATAFTGGVDAQDARGVARPEDVVRLRGGRLNVLVGNNRSHQHPGGIHRAGYNGIFALTAAEQAESPFVPAYAGWNLEHYFDGKGRTERSVFFEPRFEEMVVTPKGARSVELYQPPTRVFRVESWTRFELLDPHYVDFSFRCIPHRQHYEGNFLGVFWASYINGPLDKSMYFLDATSSLDRPLWRQLCTQAHNRDSTVRHADDNLDLQFDQASTLFANMSPLRYSVPCFYGRFQNMVLITLFRPQQTLRFTHSPSGGGTTAKGDDTNPAWDFQWIIPSPQAGQPYELEGRLVYKPWRGRDDVLAEVAKYLKRSEPSKETRSTAPAP